MDIELERLVAEFKRLVHDLGAFFLVRLIGREQ